MFGLVYHSYIHTKLRVNLPMRYAYFLRYTDSRNRGQNTQDNKNRIFHKQIFFIVLTVFTCGFASRFYVLMWSTSVALSDWGQVPVFTLPLGTLF